MVVEDGADRPVPAAIVEIWRSEQSPQTARRYLTDRSGRFATGFLEKGDYELRVTAAGYYAAAHG
ncbi:MAG: carboxypeptidase regulatory-like domain-containing protein, partial [Caldilineaceae bacterium]|nr:carboxypeptidase regulatory-like domain-containing protein [Caldilineaceae bacterium]